MKYECLSISEPDNAQRSLATQNHPAIQRAFLGIEEQTADMARQLALGSQKQPNLIVCGPPCQPYSRLRSNRNEFGIAQHRLTGVIDLVTSLIQTARPEVAIVEQVAAFGDATDDDGDKADTDGSSASSPLTDFLESLDVNGGYKHLARNLHYFR